MTIGLLLPSSIFATEKHQGDTSYSRYEQYVSEGILGKDVSFQDWKTLVELSYKLEEALSNSTDFEEVYSSSDEELRSSFKPKKGDVLITNGTSSAGILGHAGIATSSRYAFHIRGPKKHPSYIEFSFWHKNYTSNGSWTKVYRHKSKKVAAAADRAVNTYWGSKAEYKITDDLKSTNVTYCSKLVWQAYYYGPSSHQANGPTRGYRLPYELPHTIHNLSYKHTYRS